jgi:hypothetical protein
MAALPVPLAQRQPGARAAAIGVARDRRLAVHATPLAGRVGPVPVPGGLRPVPSMVRPVSAPEPRRAELPLPLAGLRLTIIALALITAATALGLVYLGQTLAAASDRYAIDTLLVERQQLLQTLRSQEGAIVRSGSEPEVIQWAQQQGLDRLGGTVRIPVR